MPTIRRAPTNACTAPKVAKRGKKRVPKGHLSRCRAFPVGTVVGFGALGRPIPRECPAENRITIPAHTRCKPPKGARQGGKSGRFRVGEEYSAAEVSKLFGDDDALEDDGSHEEALARRRRYQPSEPRRLLAADRAPSARAFRLPTFVGPESLTAEGKKARERVASGKPLTAKQQATEDLRTESVNRAMREMTELASSARGRKPDIEDLNPRAFDVNPCTGTLYEEFASGVSFKDAFEYIGYSKDEHGEGPKGRPSQKRIVNQMGAAKQLRWQENLFGCYLDLWCKSNPKLCADSFGLEGMRARSARGKRR